MYQITSTRLNCNLFCSPLRAQVSAVSAPSAPIPDQIRKSPKSTHVSKKTFLDFPTARQQMREQQLGSYAHWIQWCKLGERPKDIPSKPDMVFKEQGWKDWADFLGYETVSDFLSFEDARKRMREHGFTSQSEFFKWCRQGQRPPCIPSSPHTHYSDSGWVSWPDFLGYNFLPFDEAREQVRGLELRSVKAWKNWAHSEKRPRNIPSNPNLVYAEKGWVSFPDWLGYKRPFSSKLTRLSFQDAREFMHKQGLDGLPAWHDWCQNGSRPVEIPSNPNRSYEEEWISWPDFLGYKSHQGGTGRAKEFLPFEEGRTFARSLGISNVKEWRIWCASSARPENIPFNPHRSYADKGWVSYSDWLGQPSGGRTASVSKSWRSFEEAREYMHKQNLGSMADWKEWCEANYKPCDIPSSPRIAYRDSGWKSWSDFLGYERGKYVKFDLSQFRLEKERQG